MTRIAMFGGSFNPIHNGHLHLLQVCKDAMNFDKVLLIPSQQPVHKVSNDMARGADRAEMCRLAIENIPWCQVDRTELEREEKSYTVLTLRTLKQRYPNDELFLLMGSDMLLSFTEWFCWQEILQLAEVCAIVRENEPMDQAMEEAKTFLETFGKPIHVLSCEPFVVSSTQVRGKIAAGEKIDGLVPQRVAQYIKKEGLYRE